jgi:hypothetical protein
MDHPQPLARSRSNGAFVNSFLFGECNSMKQQIKHRYTDAVLFECDVPDDVSSGLRMRHALEKAVSERAYLAGAILARANLARANLAGAYLADANLADANLAGAYLARANLAGAYLADANLAGAYLAGAILAGAYLARANLAGAKFSEDKLLIGKRPYMAIGPIGSRCAMVNLWITDKGPMVKAGCFTGTLEEFAAAVTKTHGTNDHAKEYEMAILMFESHCSIWTPEVTA